jgi:tungstate transport system ATP-binding protein
MQSIVSLNDVSKRYGSRTALEVKRLELLPGRIYALAGPNGAGKSTLLAILALLTPPCSGQVSFNGQRVTGNRDRLRLRPQVTLVHQSPYLFRGTVADNVAFGLRQRSVPSAMCHELVQAALERVGLAEFAPRRVDQLSGGEAQRVAIARALALEPRLLLLDEPFSALDPDSTARLEELLRTLAANGTTVVVSSHDGAQRRRLEAEEIRLAEGRLAA